MPLTLDSALPPRDASRGACARAVWMCTRMCTFWSRDLGVQGLLRGLDHDRELLEEERLLQRELVLLTEGEVF